MLIRRVFFLGQEDSTRYAQLRCHVLAMHSMRNLHQVKFIFPYKKCTVRIHLGKSSLIILIFRIKNKTICQYLSEFSATSELISNCLCLSVRTVQSVSLCQTFSVMSVQYQYLSKLSAKRGRVRTFLNQWCCWQC